MEDIRLFLKKIAKNQYKLSIAYREGYNLYKYKFDIGFTLLFKETEEGIELTHENKTYTNLNEIQLILFDIFNYRNIEYIDVYLQHKIDNYKTSARIEDIYDDYYDDTKNELVCMRQILLDNDKKIIKMKFVVVEETDYYLYYNDETISGFEEILIKINQLF